MYLQSKAVTVEKLPTYRLKALAKNRGTLFNRLIDEVTTVMLAEYDAETRFRLRAERGAGKSDVDLSLLAKAAVD